MLRLIKDTIKEYKMKGDCSPRYAVSVSTELFLPFTVPTHVLYLWVPLRSLIRNLAIDIYMSYFISNLESVEIKRCARICAILNGLEQPDKYVYLVYSPVNLFPFVTQSRSAFSCHRF